MSIVNKAEKDDLVICLISGNKVANAVKEIITALKKQNQHPEEIIKQDSEVNPSRQKNLRPKIIAGLCPDWLEDRAGTLAEETV